MNGVKRVKTKIIKFRVPEPMEKFLRDLLNEMRAFRKDNNYTMSDMIRDMISYFIISYSLGHLTKTLPELKNELKDFLIGKGHKSS